MTFFSLKLFPLIASGPQKYKHKIGHKYFTFQHPKKLETLFYNLPPMQNLAKAVFRLMLFGVILLAFGIFSAEKIPPSGTQHAIWPLYVIWIIYAFICCLDVFRGVLARRLSQFAVVAFIFSLIFLFVIS